MQHLQPNSTLQGGKYKIISILGQGGFGITYLAENTMLDGKVAIKEFFFKEYCDRDEATSHVTLGTSGNRDIVERFKVKFIKEARTIFKLNHPNIVRILDIFEENGTAYYVMEYIEGESLSNMVKRRGFIPEAEAIGYIKNAADALSYIHSKNMNHLDIKPGNIMKCQEDGQIFVIDFGVAKQYDAETLKGDTTTPVGISKGFSPNEQYTLEGVQSFSPQSDVYALAATLFKLLTGTTPPEAMTIQDEGLPTEELKAKNISQNVINALNAAMQSKRKRTQSVEEFISNLSAPQLSATSDDAPTIFTPTNHVSDNFVMNNCTSKQDLLDKYKGYKYASKWKKPLLADVLRIFSFFSATIWVIVLLFALLDAFTVSIKSERLDYDWEGQQQYRVWVGGAYSVVPHGLGISYVSPRGIYSKSGARKKAFKNFYAEASARSFGMLTLIATSLLFVYLLNRRLPRKKHGQISDFADYIQKYRILLFGFRDKYKLYIKNGKYGVVNVSRYTKVTDPIFDDICWEKKNKFFIGVQGQNKNLYDVKKGILL